MFVKGGTTFEVRTCVFVSVVQRPAHEVFVRDSKVPCEKTPMKEKAHSTKTNTHLPTSTNFNCRTTSHGKHLHTNTHELTFKHQHPRTHIHTPTLTNSYSHTKARELTFAHRHSRNDPTSRAKTSYLSGGQHHTHCAPRYLSILTRGICKTHRYRCRHRHGTDRQTQIQIQT